MGIARIDLADAGSPERIVMEILKREPKLPIPVPIEKLCAQLDIVGIKPLTTPGFEGALITGPDKHSGIILYNQASPPKRRRFTIAHELCHFLAPSHVPDSDGRFLCSQSDMLLLSHNEQDRRRRMEVEANRFASLILLPPPRFRQDVDRSHEPNIQHIKELSEKYEVSLEAVSRAYVTFRSDLVSIVITQHGRVLRYYKDDRRFPFVTVPYNAPVPSHSLLFRKKHQQGIPSDPYEIDAGVWIDVARGRRAPVLYEQVYLQSQGFALIMLTIEQTEDDEYDRDAERTAKQRYRDHQARWRE